MVKTIYFSYNIYMADPVETHMSVNTNISTGRVAWNNFVGGLFWGLGSVIGATIIVAILVAFFRTIDFVPYFSNFTNQILNSVQQKQTQQYNISPQQLQQLQQTQQLQR